MSNLNIFQNSTKSVPTSDPQIVRVDMEEAQIGGRKSHLPAKHTSPGTESLACAECKHGAGAVSHGRRRNLGRRVRAPQARARRRHQR